MSTGNLEPIRTIDSNQCLRQWWWGRARTLRQFSQEDPQLLSVPMPTKVYTISFFNTQEAVSTFVSDIMCALPDNRFCSGFWQESRQRKTPSKGNKQLKYDWLAVLHIVVRCVGCMYVCVDWQDKPGYLRLVLVAATPSEAGCKSNEAGQRIQHNNKQ